MFEADLDRGLLWWKPRDGQSAWNARFAGKQAGALHKGYVRVRIGDTKYFAHRIIWKMATGDEPPFVDHANGDKADNSLSNLRAATHSQNMCNARRSPSKSGLRGVAPNGRKWAAKVRVNNRQFYVGTFETREQAAAAYDQMAKKMHGQFAVTNESLGLI
jgi:hypothetical protein